MQKASLSANKILYTVLAVIIALTALSACSKKQTAENKDGDYVSFTDALGRTVSLQKGTLRAAALIGSFADVWVLSGGEICAAPEDARDDFGLDFTDTVNLGGAHSPGLEALFSSNPDLVIASASTSSNIELKEPLESAGIPLAYFDVDCFDDYLKMLGICTDITGRKDLYEKNGLTLKKEIENAKAEFVKSELPEDNRRVLILRISSTSVKAKGSEGTILGEMLSELGCINIADSDKTLLENLSVESIIRMKPYHIFAVTMGDDTEKAKENLSKLIEENPAWKTLDAIKENRLHLMDKKLFNLKPNANWLKSYEELIEILLCQK